MNDDLLEKQNILQRQAKDVLKHLGLINLLSNYGKVKIVGSMALELMTWPDIDIDLESNDEINNKDYLEIVKDIFNYESIKKLTLIDNRSSFEKNRPKSMYIGIIYDLDDIDWKIDIRYLNSSDASAGDSLKQIKSKLTSEKVQAILEIKTNFHSHPKYRKEFSGYDIYNAVLEEGILTIDDFKEFLKGKEIK